MSRHILSGPEVVDDTYAGIMTGTEQTLRRRRVYQGKHRTWEIVPRYGTDLDNDRWTVIGNPIPGEANPAADYEDGQYSSLAQARKALAKARILDDGSHRKD